MQLCVGMLEEEDAINILDTHSVMQQGYKERGRKPLS